MKKGLLLFLLIASSASALNDAYILVDTDNTGMCFSLGSPDSPVCQGEYLRVNGTSDHDLYLVNGYSRSLTFNISEAAVNQTVMDSVMQNWMVDPIYVVLGLGGLFAFIIVFFGGAYVAAAYIVDHIP